MPGQKYRYKYLNKRAIISVASLCHHRVQTITYF
nr:MAG TPA_asm: hypothetical protein [Caudoviricetes sp.]DAV04252.1 MAG TPA: hypothetical protein [Caudoviricetes sp.]